MTVRSALVALVAVALAGCAPPFIGGSYTARAVASPNGYRAGQVTLAFQPDETVRVTVASGSTPLCGSSYNTMFSTRWVSNTPGFVVINTSCNHEIALCGTMVNVCNVFEGTVGALEVSDRALTSTTLRTVVFYRD